MARGKTLWEMFVEWLRSDPVEFRFFNPLKAKIGSFVTIDEIEWKDLDFGVEEIREYRRHLGRKEFLSVDYLLLARPLGKPEVAARLRLNPLPDPDRAGGQTHHALLLSLDDEMAYSEDFHEVLKDDTGEFKILQDGEITAVFTRINDVRNPYKTDVAIIKDENLDKKVEKDEVEHIQISYWDYWRDVSDTGVTKKEYLFVEMDDDSGWFQIWRGHEIDMQRAFVVT